MKKCPAAEIVELCVTLDKDFSWKEKKKSALHLHGEKKNIQRERREILYVWQRYTALKRG